jgi:beta-glucosidase
MCNHAGVVDDLGDLLELNRGFVVATGIECSAPLIANGVRQDELRKTGHWERYAEDLALVAEFGIRYVRYGIPFHVVAADPGQLDWSWTDKALEALRRSGLIPIADLLHFGVPDDLSGLGDPRLPERFVRYAAAFADRYPWIRYYTPVNEPLVGAVVSAKLGWWNERRRDQPALVAAIDRSVACVVLAMEAIRDRRPDAIFIQSDACETYIPADADAEAGVAFLNERRFVTFDLTYGRRPAPSVVAWLLENGMSDARLAWFEARGTSEGCILGNDYYRGNEWLVAAGGRTRRAPQRRGYERLAREYHARYRVPFMLTETNVEGRAALSWLREVWDDALSLRDDGLPIRGFCWYGFIDHVDWDSALRLDRGRPNDCGLLDLDRRPHAVGERYRELAQAARRGRLAYIGRDASRRRRHERRRAA